METKKRVVDFEIYLGPGAQLIEYALFDPESMSRMVQFHTTHCGVIIPCTINSVTREEMGVWRLRGLTAGGDEYEATYNTHNRKGVIRVFAETD